MPTFNIHSAVADPTSAPAATSDYDEQHREARQFYRDVLVTLRDGDVPYLVGGAYAFARFTGIKRPTKDFDIFMRPADLERGLAVLAAAGFTTDVTYPHWLAKAGRGLPLRRHHLQLGQRRRPGGRRMVRTCRAGRDLRPAGHALPAEEMIWSKAFVMERERYDGADVIHLLHARGRHLDWDRLMRRFDEYWRVLFMNLVLYGFVYPGDPTPAPEWVMTELRRRLDAELAQPPSREKLCRGTVISREQYLVDTLDRGYRDGREAPNGNMTAQEIRDWTAAIASRK